LLFNIFSYYLFFANLYLQTNSKYLLYWMLDWQDDV